MGGGERFSISSYDSHIHTIAKSPHFYSRWSEWYVNKAHTEPEDIPDPGVPLGLSNQFIELSPNATAEQRRRSLMISDHTFRNFTTFEGVLRAVGSFGRYQIYTFIIVFYATLMWAGNLAFMSFAELKPEVWECNYTNSTKTFTEPFEYDKDDAVFCKQYKACPPHNRTILKAEFIGIREEWGLFCEEAWIPSFIVEIQAFGRIIGSLLGGHLGDHVGRKRTFFTAQFGICLSSVMATASQSWEALTAMLSLNGFFYGIVDVTLTVFVLEMVDSRHRLIANATSQLCLAYVVITLVAYATMTWRLYLVIVNVLSAPLLIFYLVTHESPRWLLQKGDSVKAAEVLTQLAGERWNNKGIIVTERELAHIPTEPNLQRFHPLHVFRNPTLARIAVGQIVAMFTCSVIANAFRQSVQQLDFSPFVDYAIYGIAMIPVIPIVLLVDLKFARFGRRALYLSSLVLIIVFLATSAVVMHLSGEETALATLFLIIASVVNSSAFYMVIIQVSIEAYPTVIRCTALGTFAVADNVGPIMVDYMLRSSESRPLLPTLIMLALAVVSLVVGFFCVPETKGLKLRDTFDDVNVTSPKKKSLATAGDSTPAP